MTSIEAKTIIQATEETLLAYCRRQRLFKPGDRVIAACSGGADSMALLLFLLHCKRELAIEVLATHVNHGLRGAASQADANFVTAFCRQNGVEMFLYDAEKAGVEIPLHASEEWARRLRYDWFDRLAAEQEALIATAHTMSDQAETLLLRLARGTGLHGAGGIAPRRGIYLRPCLCLTRCETEAYCEANGQNYVQDETNATDEYARNRVRHGAVPVLQSVNPAAEKAIARFCTQMQELDSWFSAEAAALLQSAATPNGYEVEPLRKADGPVLKAALHTLVAPVRDAEEKYVSLLRFLIMQGQGTLQLTREISYKVKDGELMCVSANRSLPPPAPPQPLEEGFFRLPGGYLVQFQIQNYEFFLKNAPIFKKDLNNCADYDKIKGSIFLRTRQPGDSFRPGGRHVRKTLKKLYNELGIPAAQRPLVPLLANGSEIVWLWDCGFAEGYGPDEKTSRVLVVHTEKTEEE